MFPPFFLSRLHLRIHFHVHIPVKLTCQIICCRFTTHTHNKCCHGTSASQPARSLHVLLITIYVHYCCSGRFCRLILQCGKDPVTLLYINLTLLKACLNLLTAQGPADKSTNTFPQMRASSCVRQGFIQHCPLPAAGGAQSLSSHSAQTILFFNLRWNIVIQLNSSVVIKIPRQYNLQYNNVLLTEVILHYENFYLLYLNIWSW